MKHFITIVLATPPCQKWSPLCIHRSLLELVIDVGKCGAETGNWHDLLQSLYMLGECLWFLSESKFIKLIIFGCFGSNTTLFLSYDCTPKYPHSSLLRASSSCFDQVDHLHNYFNPLQLPCHCSPNLYIAPVYSKQYNSA